MRVAFIVLALVVGAGVLAGVDPAPVGAGAPAVATAGSLRATISARPWGVSFTDRSGREVLAEHPGTGPGPIGTLGFRAAGGWRHATRVLAARVEGRGYLAELATTDPSRRLEVRLVPDAEGVIALRARVLGPAADVDALGIGFRARPGERYVGFGERSDAVDQRGATVENYVSDGPFQPAERPFVSAVIPPWGFRGTDGDTYHPVPWLLSTAGYGVLVDNPETSYYRLDADDGWSVEVTSAPPGEAAAPPAPAELALRVFAGPHPADALRRFTAATGRQPEPAAPWVFGPWFQPTGSPEDRRGQLARLQEADAPVSVAQTYTHYLPCGDHRSRREQERAMVDAFHAAGLAVTTYVNPMLCTTYQPLFDEAVRRGALTANRLGEPYLYPYSTASQFLVGQFDFTSPAGRELYARVLAEAVTDGHDGWMEDFGEYTPLDSLAADGTPGTAMHNRYPVDYHCASEAFARAQDRPLVRFQRSGWTGAARCAQVVWGGDPTTGWGFDGLRSAVTQALSMGLSGVSRWGSDIGGFFALGTQQLTPELLIRWIQFGAVSGVMRATSEGVAVPAKNRPQIWEPPVLPHWRRYAKLRTQLYPYLVAADATYRRTGLPLMRHLALADPHDPRATAAEDEFLLGPDLLAAPVTEPGATQRALYLPGGRWVDLWRSVRYDQRSGGLVLDAARTLPGGREVTLPAPLAELPLLARAGAILPLLPPDVTTLTRYTDDELDLLAFPRGRSEAGVLHGERLLSAEAAGRWELTVDGARERSYRLQGSLATLEQDLTPCRVTLDGRPLPPDAWRYDPRREVLTVQFRTRSGRLAVEDCG